MLSEILHREKVYDAKQAVAAHEAAIREASSSATGDLTASRGFAAAAAT